LAAAGLFVIELDPVSVQVGHGAILALKMADVALTPE